MSLEFLVWFLGLAAANFFFTIPLYILTAFIVNKTKTKGDLKIFSFSFGFLMILMILLQSFTIANMVSIFLEVLLLIWMGNVLYFRKGLSDGEGKEIRE